LTNDAKQSICQPRSLAGSRLKPSFSRREKPRSAAPERALSFNLEDRLPIVCAAHKECANTQICAAQIFGSIRRGAAFPIRRETLLVASFMVLPEVTAADDVSRPSTALD
jgi:hypothetical protein